MLYDSATGAAREAGATATRRATPATPQAAPDVPEPVAASLASAGLRYVDDSGPGISRRRRGDNFYYVNAKGGRIRDASTIDRINALAIPPAYESVWICPDPSGHLQATGFDARGRKQYRYHPDWIALRDTDKYDRLIAFGRALPKLRRRVSRELKTPGMPREKVLAAVVRLLDTTLIRVGSTRYAKENRTYGLTTLRRRHVRVQANQVRFLFTGKSGVEHDVTLNDRQLARIIRACTELPGQHLFKYRDEDGEIREIGSADVNAFLQEITGADFTAKDFRTWSASAQALAMLRKPDPGALASETARKRAVTAAISEVAQRLRNTVAVCRKCYVHPAVVEGFMLDQLCDGDTCRRALTGLTIGETRLLALLATRETKA